MKKDDAKDESLERTYPELNLEKWSIWQPAHSKNKLTELVIERGPARVEITANSKYGPLTTEDQKVYYGLIKLFWKWLWQQENRSSERTYLSTRDLARVLKKKWNGKVAKVIAGSMYRLRFTAFIWQNSYYDSTTKQTITFLDTFTILSDLKVAKTEADGKVNKEVGYFRFCDLIAQNLLNGYTKPLLLETVLNFKSELAQMLYHHLDLVMADKDHYERRTEALCFGDLQLKGAEYQKPSHRKRQLEKALPELQGVQITTGTLTSVELAQTKDGKDYKLVCHKRAGTAATIQEHQQTKSQAKTREINDQVQAEELVTQPAKPAAAPATTHPQTPAQAAPQATALAVVQYFHQQARQVDNYQPGSRELSQAQAIIDKYGPEQAKFAVTFAVQEARKTNFQMRTFGALRQYVQEALAEYKAMQRQEAIQREQAAQARQQVDARLKAMPPQQYRTLYEQIKQQLLIDMPALQADTLELFVKDDMIRRIDQQERKEV